MSLFVVFRLYFSNILFLLHSHKCFCHNTYLWDKRGKKSELYVRHLDFEEKFEKFESSFERVEIVDI